MEEHYITLPIIYDAEIIPKGCRKSRIVPILDEYLFSIPIADKLIPAGIHIGLNGHCEVYYGSESGIFTSLGCYKNQKDINNKNEIFEQLNFQNINYNFIKEEKTLQDFLYDKINILKEYIKENKNSVSFIGKYNDFYNNLLLNKAEPIYLLEDKKQKEIFLENDDRIKHISDNKNKKIKQIQNILNNYVIYDNLIYKKTEEPKLKIPYFKDRMGSSKNIISRQILSYDKPNQQNKKTFSYPYIYFNILDMDIAFNCALEFAKKAQIYTEPTVGYEDNFIILNQKYFLNNPYKNIIDNFIEDSGFALNLLNRIENIETDDIYDKVTNILGDIKKNGYKKDEIIFLLSFLKINIKDAIIQDFVELGEIILKNIENTNNHSNILKTKTEIEYNLIPGCVDLKKENKNFTL